MINFQSHFKRLHNSLHFQKQCSLSRKRYVFVQIKNAIGSLQRRLWIKRWKFQKTVQTPVFKNIVGMKCSGPSQRCQLCRIHARKLNDNQISTIDLCRTGNKNETTVLWRCTGIRKDVKHVKSTTVVRSDHFNDCTILIATFRAPKPQSSVVLPGARSLEWCTTHFIRLV